MTVLQGVEKFLRGIQNDERRCYLRVAALKRAVSQPKVLDVLLEEVGVPGKLGALRKLSDEAKFDAIADEIDHLCKSPTSHWSGVRGGEALAGFLFRSQLSHKFVEQELFCGVRKEADLLAPVARWMACQELNVHAEIPMGVKRADVVGHRPPSWGGLKGRQFVGIELKNDIKVFESAIDQMTTYGDYAHKVYLACTPMMAADYLCKHADGRGVKHWDASALDRKLQRLGFGLLLVEGIQVFEHVVPRSNEVNAAKVEEVMSFLTDKTRVVMAPVARAS